LSRSRWIIGDVQMLSTRAKLLELSWKCGSRKCDTGKNPRVENAGVA